MMNNGKSKKMIPDIRFAGYTDDWEQRKLGGNADITTGKLDANAMDENGEYDFYTSGVKTYKIDQWAFEGPAITIAGNGATVGYMHFADGKFNAYQRTYVLQNMKIDRTFLYVSISKALPRKIQEEARTGNIPYIVMDMLTSLSFKVPEIDEQMKLGTLISNVEQVITLHQRNTFPLVNLN
ncbi:restriction endonuclease subunit S [Fructobacillus sp. W13]|uniref:Restriction endonuclease subunit S n=1 Tax=Fructobacillus apis TaxID=2935017 RepID=A0ABT0ZRJ5_9LACO|nr:restriction endonuclease subunit S [Fructobacillus apis]MCO0832619.1 restriction endonuclease subunit S [Fructobacillus apis]